MHAHHSHRHHKSGEQQTAQPDRQADQLVDQRGGTGNHDNGNAEQQQTLHGADQQPQLGPVTGGEHPSHILLPGGLHQPQGGVVHIGENEGHAQKAHQTNGAEAGEKLPQLLTGYKAGAQHHAGKGQGKLFCRNLFHKIPLEACQNLYYYSIYYSIAGTQVARECLWLTVFYGKSETAVIKNERKEPVAKCSPVIANQ